LHDIDAGAFDQVGHGHPSLRNNLASSRKHG